jgi:hypothetical protein
MAVPYCCQVGGLSPLYCRSLVQQKAPELMESEVEQVRMQDNSLKLRPTSP